MDVKPIFYKQEKIAIVSSIDHCHVLRLEDESEAGEFAAIGPLGNFFVTEIDFYGFDPDNDQGQPDFLFLHGAGHSDASRGEVLFRDMAANGISVVAFTMSGGGDAKLMPRYSSLTRRLEESAAVIDYFFPEVDAMTISGSSMGAMIASMLVPRYGIVKEGKHDPGDVEALDKAYAQYYADCGDVINFVLMRGDSDTQIPEPFFKLLQGKLRDLNPDGDFATHIIKDCSHSVLDHYRRCVSLDTSTYILKTICEFVRR